MTHTNRQRRSVADVLAIVAGERSTVVMRPRPLDTYSIALRDWAALQAELQDKQLTGALSRSIALPPEGRAANSLVFAAFSRQIADALLAGRTKLAVEVALGPDKLRGFIVALRALGAYTRTLIDDGTLQREPEGISMSLIDDVAEELTDLAESPFDPGIDVGDYVTVFAGAGAEYHSEELDLRTCRQGVADWIAAGLVVHDACRHGDVDAALIPDADTRVLIETTRAIVNFQTSDAILDGRQARVLHLPLDHEQFADMVEGVQRWRPALEAAMRHRDFEPSASLDRLLDSLTTATPAAPDRQGGS